MNQSEERQKNILKVTEAALQLFMSDGVANTSVTQIAKASDLTPMSVYRYFGTKEKLVFHVWQYALTVFYQHYDARYQEIKRESGTGYDRFVTCMRAYSILYKEYPQWYSYTHEMFTYRASPKETESTDLKSVFWQYYDKEIPIPALRALREGVEDGSINENVNIYAVYQILLNAYTGTTLYETVSFGVSPEDIIKITGNLIANYIKKPQ